MQANRFVALVGFCVFSLSAFAQDTVTVIPREEYEAGGLHRLLFGSGWRTLWTTPTVVDRIDLASYGGGLRPVKLGAEPGTLRFRGGNGKEYKFQSFLREPQSVVHPFLLNLYTESVTNDLVSATNPVAVLVATPLLEAAGVVNASAEVVQLPDDERLGEYRDEFKELVGLMDESPLPETPGDMYAWTKQVISTTELFERLDASNDEHVDAVEYLKARLMDIFLGDWDRGTEQWRWGGYKEGKGIRWSPIPLDRDQAFSRYGGLVSLPRFSESYPSIASLTWTARHTDSRLLSSIDHATWDAATGEVQAALTDEVIEDAVRMMPPEMYEKEGAPLTQALKVRRDKLKEASQEWYEHLAHTIDVWSSNMQEYAEIDRLNNDSVRLQLFKRDNETGGAKGEPFFERMFSRSETCEIRLYLQGGDDFTIIKGNADGSVPIRVIGGEGSDELADSSTVRGKLFGFLPIKVTKTATYFYESDRKAEFIYGSSTAAYPDEFVRPAEDSLKYEPLYRDRGHRWQYRPLLGFNSDDGLFVGAKVQLTDYDFRAIPYDDRAMLHGGYAFGPGRYRIVYEHEFPQTLGGTLNLLARVSNLERVNFFGFGNNTKFEKARADKDLYRVDLQQYAFQPSYAYSLLENVTLSATAGVRMFQTDTASLADTAVLRMTKPYGVQDALYAIAGLSGTYDSRDNAVAPLKGVYFTLGTLWNPEIFDNKFAYTKAYSEFRGFFTAPLLGGATIAMRVRGEKIFGNRFPYYEASFLGGATDLRGYARERFAGDALVLATAELRLNIGSFAIVVPGSYGIHLFAEEGRVFFEKEVSESRHGSFGGGVWIAPRGAKNTLAVTIAKSPEQMTVALTTGFAF